MLTDIVYDINSNTNFIMEMERGNIGTVSDIVTEADTPTGILVNEIPAQTGGATEYAFAF